MKNSFKYAAPIIWLFLVGAGFTSSSLFLLSSFGKASIGNSLWLYAGRFPENSQTAFKAEMIDARAYKVEKVFEKFKCPLTGRGEFIVAKADEYEIPYWLISAVSFQESGCGKKTPKVEGLTESYNAWGYGIWGKNVKTFESWEAGITAVSKYFGINFYSKGITDPCEIMKVYTPPSKGSWCEGIKYFGEMIDKFETE